MKYVFPPGQKLGWLIDVVMNYGVVTQGELTIIGQDGKTKVVHEGEHEAFCSHAILVYR